MFAEPKPTAERPLNRSSRRSLARAFRHRFTSSLARFRREEDGVAAIEFAFALVLVFVPLFMGFAELAHMQQRTTGLNTTTAMVADMMAQFAVVDKNTLDEVLTTAEYVMGARTVAANSNELSMMVMGVVVPKAGSADTTPYVRWSMSNKGTSTCSLGSPLPSGVATPTSTDRLLIVADGALSYTSQFNFFRSGKTELDHRSIYAPRLSGSTTGPNTCPKP